MKMEILTSVCLMIMAIAASVGALSLLDSVTGFDIAVIAGVLVGSAALVCINMLTVDNYDSVNREKLKAFAVHEQETELEPEAWDLTLLDGLGGEVGSKMTASDSIAFVQWLEYRHEESYIRLKKLWEWDHNG